MGLNAEINVVSLIDVMMLLMVIFMITAPIMQTIFADGCVDPVGTVVSLNGVVASLAVTEFMVWITGMRDPKRCLVYHAESGIVTRSQDPPAPQCPKCGR